MEMKELDGVIKIKNGTPRWTIPVVFGDYVYPSATDLADDKGLRKSEISRAVRHGDGPYVDKVRVATADEIAETWPGVVDLRGKKSEARADKKKIVGRVSKVTVTANGKISVNGSCGVPVVYNGVIYDTAKNMGRTLGIPRGQLWKMKCEDEYRQATADEIKAAWPDAEWAESRPRGSAPKKDVVPYREKGGQAFILDDGRWRLAVIHDGKVRANSNELGAELGVKRDTIIKCARAGNRGLRLATLDEVREHLGNTNTVPVGLPSTAPVDTPVPVFMAFTWPDGAVTVRGPSGLCVTRLQATDIPHELLNCCEWV